MRARHRRRAVPVPLPQGESVCREPHTLVPVHADVGEDRILLEDAQHDAEPVYGEEEEEEIVSEAPQPLPRA